MHRRWPTFSEDCVDPAPSFTNCAVDYFGPWIIRQGRKEVKRYYVVFTCMASGAIHLEISNTMETNSFINALRRFICRRGPIRILRSDQGTNFVGARRELKEALMELDQRKISSELLKDGCDWITFRMNVRSASHMGGVWERQIRSVRGVLSALLDSNGAQLDDESLSTLMCEAEAIVNSRPLTVDPLTDPDSPSPLTPNHLLTMKSRIVMPPPGIFQDADKYSRRRWRRVQHLADEFWCRWRKEFLQSLQIRPKWSQPRRNLCVRDIVIIKDDNLAHNHWELARVTEVREGKDGHVRSVKLIVADPTLDSKAKRTRPAKVLERPVHKLVLLVRGDEVMNDEDSRSVPVEEPSS